MKELEQPIQDKQLETIELVAEQEKKKQLTLIGSQRQIPGLTLWEYNHVTHILDKAQFKKEERFELTSLDPEKVNKLIHRKKVDIKENCVYTQALNRKNAIKKFKQRGFTIFN